MTQQIINISETPEGNLLIKLIDTDENRLEIHDLVKYYGYECAWAELLEPFSTNGSYTLITPELIGALTGSPIIASAPPSYNQDSDDMFLELQAKTWFYPDYMVKDEFTELIETGKVMFNRA